MIDTEIIERYFVARGWVPYDADANNNIEPKRWWNTINHMKLEELPKILTDYPAFKEHVLEVMGKEGALPFITWMDNKDGSYWRSAGWDIPHPTEEIIFGTEIFDNNMLHPFIIGATEYFEGKK